MSPHPYLVNDLLPPPSPPNPAHTALNPTTIFARTPINLPITLSPNDTDTAVLSGQNKVGVCSTNGCVGFIVLGVIAVVALAIILTCWGLYRWRKARNAKAHSKDIEMNAGAGVKGRGRKDRDEFELAHPPTPETVRKKRAEKLRRNESVKERDVKMGVGYLGRNSTRSSTATATGGSILKAVQDAGNKSAEAVKKQPDRDVDRHSSSSSSSSTSSLTAADMEGMEDIALDNDELGPSNHSPDALAPHDNNHHLGNRNSTITTLGETEAGKHCVVANRSSNSTLASSVSSLGTASTLVERYPEPGSYGNFAGARNSNNSSSIRHHPTTTSVRDICSVEELGGEHVRREDLGRDF